MSILKRQGELVDVDGLLLPKYGALKVGEIQEFNAFVQTWPELRKGLTDKQADVKGSLHCATILLKRIDPEWTIEHSEAKLWTLPSDGKIGGENVCFEPDSLFIEKLYQFFQGELNRWPNENAPAEEAEVQEPGKKPTGKKSTGDSAAASPAAKTSRASKAS